MMIIKNPMQPIIRDENDVLRFKSNSIVRYLLDNGTIDLCDLAKIPFDNSDREQFAQLIGYSLDGFGSLSYVTNDTYEIAAATVHGGLAKTEAQIVYLTEELDAIRKSLRDPIARLYGIHPENLDSIY